VNVEKKVLDRLFLYQERIKNNEKIDYDISYLFRQKKDSGTEIISQ